MKKCVFSCLESNKLCKNKDCRYWIDFGEDLNCAFIAIEKNGEMTLREVSERLGISFVRVKQIQDKALKKAIRQIKKTN